MSGERKLTHLISNQPEENQNPEAQEETQPEEKNALEPFAINVEVDALTGSECITRDDNTLTVK